MAFAVELAQKRWRGHIALAEIAGVTAGNQIAVGMYARGTAALAAQQGLWLDVVEHAIAWIQFPPAIETVAALAAVDGPAQRAFLKKIHRLDVGLGRRRRPAGFENLLRQAQLQGVAALTDGNNA